MSGETGGIIFMFAGTVLVIMAVKGTLRKTWAALTGQADMPGVTSPGVGAVGGQTQTPPSQATADLCTRMGGHQEQRGNGMVCVPNGSTTAFPELVPTPQTGLPGSGSTVGTLTPGVSA